MMPTYQRVILISLAIVTLIWFLYKHVQAEKTGKIDVRDSRHERVPRYITREENPDEFHKHQRTNWIILAALVGAIVVALVK
jgi:hypothetical protein